LRAPGSCTRCLSAKMAFSKWQKKCELERLQRWACTRTCSHRTTHRDIAAAEEKKFCFPHSWSWRLPFESAGRIRFTCRFFRRNIFVGTMLVRVIGVPSTFTNSDTSLHPFFHISPSDSQPAGQTLNPSPSQFRGLRGSPGGTSVAAQCPHCLAHANVSVRRGCW